jgi:hypothetical protein
MGAQPGKRLLCGDPGEGRAQQTNFQTNPAAA